MNPDQIEREVGRRELKQLWEKLGISNLLECLADVIDADTRLVEQSGRLAAEVESRDALTHTLRKTAKSFREET